MVRLIGYIMKKILGKKSMHEQLGSSYIEEDYGVEKSMGRIKVLGKTNMYFLRSFQMKKL